MAKTIDIIIRAKDITEAAWKSMQSRAIRAGNRIKKAFSGIAGAAKIVSRAVLGIGAATAASAIALIKLGSDSEETGSKFEAVFRDIRSEANKTAKNLSRDFRITSTEAKKLLGNTADLLTGFGFTQKEALKLSEQVQRLGIDLASFTNFSGGAEGAAGALTKLLLGETEQAKSLGIVVRQGSDEYKNAVKQKMRDLGVTTLQAKALTALEMATAQSKNAIGDYARTSQGAANAMRGLRSSIVGMLEKLGLAIINGVDLGRTMLRWADALREFHESEAFENITNKFKIWLGDAKTLVETLAKGGEGRGEVFEALGIVLKESLATGADKAAKILVSAAKEVGTQIGTAAKKVWSGESVKAFAKRDGEALGSMVADGMINTFQALFPATFLSAEQEAERVRRRGAIKARNLQKELSNESTTGEEKTPLQVALENLKGLAEKYKTTVNETTDALDEQLAKEKAITEEKAKAVKSAEDLAKAVKEEGEFLAINAKEAEKRFEKQFQDAKKLKAVNKEIAVHEQKDRHIENQQGIELIDQDIAAANKRLAVLAKSTKERKAEQREKDLGDKREERLLDKQARGIKIGRQSRDWIEQRELMRKIKQDEAMKKVMENNAREIAKVELKEHREAQLIELRKTRELLQDNLRAAAVG